MELKMSEKEKRIKFRVWDKVNKVMSYEYPFFLSLEGDVWFWHGSKEDFFPLKQNEFVIMLFTGKRDINGKDIYEGDIVEDSVGEKYIVEWGDMECGFYLFQISSSRTFYFADFQNELKVVGNIWENNEVENE